MRLEVYIWGMLYTRNKKTPTQLIVMNINYVIV